MQITTSAGRQIPYTLPRKRAGHRGDPPAGTPWGRPDSRGSARVPVENELVQNSVSRWGRHLYPQWFWNGLDKKSLLAGVIPCEFK